ncbi:MAG: aspartyl protease family protein [Chitinophagales bacterium]
MSKKIIIPIEVVNLQEEGYHLFVAARLGNHSLRLLIDTGASKTVFDKALMADHFSHFRLEANEQLTTGVGTNTIQSEFTEITLLKIGGLEIPSFKIAVLDLSHVNETYSLINLVAIHGVIGCDLLVEFDAVINFKRCQLKLKSITS